MDFAERGVLGKVFVRKVDVYSDDDRSQYIENLRQSHRTYHEPYCGIFFRETKNTYYGEEISHEDKHGENKQGDDDGSVDRRGFS